MKSEVLGSLQKALTLVGRSEKAAQSRLMAVVNAEGLLRLHTLGRGPQRGMDTAPGPASATEALQGVCRAG